MAVTIEDLAKLIGVELSDESTMDDVRTKFNSVFVAKNIAHELEDIKAKVVGEEFKMLRRDAEKSGFISSDDLKDGDKWKHPRDIYKSVFENITAQMDAVKKQSTEGLDKRLSDFQRAIEEKDKSLKDYQTQNEELSGKIAEITSDFNNKLTSAKTNYLLKDITSQFEYADHASKFAKDGFQKHMSEKYIFPLKVDDGGNEILEVKTKDGHYIPSASDATKFATPAEIWKQELEQGKLLKVNNADSNKKVVNLYSSDKKGSDKTPTGNYMRDPYVPGKR